MLTHCHKTNSNTDIAYIVRKKKLFTSFFFVKCPLHL
jgi:hypothetical protein